MRISKVIGVTRAGWHGLTARESAVLAAVERRLGNAEIADEFHISVRTVESHIASLRRKLDVDSRSKLITAARDRRGSAVAVPHNSFVGRADDLSAVQALLDGSRWVTVVGAPGCGKTRLALEVAAAGARVPVVAELEHATPDEVVGVVARAIGLGTDGAADPVAACGVALGPQPYLLVVDNCDRVTDAVGEVVGQLLARAGSLTVLATSRSPIGSSDETVYPLAPLRTSEHDQAAAVQLFFDRARSAAPGVSLAAGDGELAARICRRLDGLPLAIELAAARMRHLPLPELADRLESDFGPLARAGPPNRHRTLEAAFAWTLDLLDSDERAVLSQLAALPGTFDLELAEAVTTSGASRIVLRLLDRSLLSPATTTDGPVRFRLLDALRAFVLERTDATVVHDARHAHAVYYAAVAAELSARARVDDSRAATQAARHLSPEAKFAVNWAIAEQHELLLPLTRALAVLAEQYGPDFDSLDAIARAARDPYVRSRATASDLLDIGIALCYGDIELVAELAALALDVADSDESELAARHLAGYADAYRHHGRPALTHLDVAERLASERHELWQLASVLQGKGLALRGRELDDPRAAIAAFESAMQTYALAGDVMHVNNARYMMASAAAEAGVQTEEAAVWAEQCVVYARESGNRHELAHALRTRATLATGPDADRDLAQAVDTFRAVGDLRCLTRSYLLLARHRSASEQVPLLRQALDVATSARDVANQSIALESLIRAQWESGAHHAAAVALGTLINLIGYGAATSRCPDDMRQELDHWKIAITEGQARTTLSARDAVSSPYS